jgi:hypothetical protein
MIRKSKRGAFAVVAAIGVASPIAAAGLATAAFAQGIYGPEQRTYSPAETGGGSPGYNERATTPNWRLKHHTHHTVHEHSTNK